MTRCPDLLTRKEAAAFLGVSVSQLEHGWGPKPLPGYRRPVMYSRRVIKRWLREQEAQCSTSGADDGGQSSSTPASVTVSPRVKQIVAQRRKKRVASALKSKTKLALEVVR